MIRENIEYRRIPHTKPLAQRDRALMRFQGSHSFCEMPYKIVIEALDHIEKRLPIVQAGLDVFTPTDVFALYLLRETILAE